MSMLAARCTRYSICHLFPSCEFCIVSFSQILNSKFYILNSLTRYYTMSLVMCPLKSKRTTILAADFADFTVFGPQRSQRTRRSNKYRRSRSLGNQRSLDTDSWLNHISVNPVNPVKKAPQAPPPNQHNSQFSIQSLS